MKTQNNIEDKTQNVPKKINAGVYKNISRYWLKGVAIIFLAVGVTLASRLIFDKNLDKLKSEELERVSNVILGLSTVFLTTSSILFVLDNLRQQSEAIKLQSKALEKQEAAIQQQEVALKHQKEAIDLQREEIHLQTLEMKQANATSAAQMQSISLQQAENTFFNLLSNHKAFVSTIQTVGVGYEGLESAIKEIKENMKVYGQSIHEKKFSEVEHTKYHPLGAFSKFPQLDSLINSYSIIIQFISEYLKDELLYHNIFNSNLHVNERFILGMAIGNEVYKPNTKKLDYTSYYLTNTPYFNSKVDGHFPSISFDYIGDKVKYVGDLSFLKTDNITVNLNSTNSNPHNLSLNKVEVRISRQAPTYESIYSESFLLSEWTFKLFDILLKGVYAITKDQEKNTRKGFDLYLFFEFSFEGKNFTVRDKRYLQIDNNVTHNGWTIELAPLFDVNNYVLKDDDDVY